MSAKKKLHWTQTPRGRAIMAQNARNRGKKKRTLNQNGDEKAIEVAYTLGWLEGWIKEAAPVVRSSKRLASTQMGQLILSIKIR